MSSGVLLDTPTFSSGIPARSSVAAHFKVSGSIARRLQRIFAHWRVSAKVTLETPDGSKTFECPGDTYILDKAR